MPQGYWRRMTKKRSKSFEFFLWGTIPKRRFVMLFEILLAAIAVYLVIDGIF